MESVEFTKIWLDFISSLLWPTIVLMVLLMFRKQFQSLLSQVKSGKMEIAGAKFSFNETASGFIASKVDDLAKQQDPNQRALIAGEIKDIAAILNSIHPISLAILISAAETGGMIWTSGTYLSRKQYFDNLEKAGLGKTIEETMSNGLLTAKIDISAQGYELLRSIGMPENSNPEIEQ